MSGAIVLLAVFLLFPGFYLHSESFRTIVEGSIEVTPETPSGNAASLGINSSVYITTGADIRFIRGVELEITAPRSWLPYRGLLFMTIYNNVSPQSSEGTADIEGNRIAFEPLPSRLRIIYHIPIRQSHGLRTTTSVTVPISGFIQPASFPVIFRLSAVEKGLTNEFEQMTFTITARPILSDEGAVRIIPRFPPQLRGRPFTVLIDDNVINSISEQVVLREGEHHLVILSDDFRNESRRFIIERARVTDLIIELQDTTPIIIFEGPQNSLVFLNNIPVSNIREPIAVEPGQHEVRFLIGDYTVMRTLNIQRGKTYRIALEVDLTIQEEE